MAKKPRTPTPRPQQRGPKRREASRRPAGFVTRRNALLAGVVAGGAIVAIVLASVLTRGGGASASSPAAKLAAAGCTFKTYPSEGRGHVNSLTAKVTYKTFPPTSGTHYFQPAVWGRYTSPLVLVQEVHNLEHGGVIVQYGDKVPQSTIDRLGAFYDSSPDAMLLAPLPKLGRKIALTAWTELATCTRYDATAFTAFRDAFRGKGPEQFPVSSLTPGSQ